MKAKVTADTAYSSDSYARMCRNAGDHLVNSGLDILLKVRQGTPDPYVIVVPDLTAADGVPEAIIEAARKLGVEVEVV